MSIDERVYVAAEKATALWAVAVSLATVWILVYAPWWWIIPFAGAAVLTYYILLFIVGFVIGARSVNEKYIANAVAEQVEDGAVGNVLVRGKVIGRYMDKDIFDWIDIKTPTGTTRYTFVGGVQRDRAGNMLLPREEGFACFDECLYQAQPESTS